jgi:Protein of unknown function DUF45
MQVEAMTLFEQPEEAYKRVFRNLKPQAAVPTVTVHFKRYANANSRIRLSSGHLLVEISDLLQGAPSTVQDALAHILISKLYRRRPDRGQVAVYRRYLNRSDIRRTLQQVRQERGRKQYRDPKGSYYNLCELFEELNFAHFSGLMSQPQLGWSLRPSRSTLGHYDPSHNAIILSGLLDSPEAPALAVRYVMFHEMLHLRYPTDYRTLRRCIHTPEFRAAEKQFPGYQTAKASLRAFVEAASKR